VSSLKDPGAVNNPNTVVNEFIAAESIPAPI
jgi:hypothetical protein